MTSRKTPLSRPRMAAMAAVAAGMLTALTAVPAAATAPPPATRAAAPASALDRYEHQKVGWTTCRTGPSDDTGKTLDEAGAQCATLRVPLDYAHPAGRSISVAISRLKATDTAHRIGVMLLNGGGPGGGSIDLPPDIGSVMGGLAARYDLVGMDPRSSGRSTPVDCDWPTGTWTRAPGTTRREFAGVVAFERGLAERCARTDGPLLPYISTRNTARDMDVVRAALGEPRLSYYGASYGTYLGAVYAQLFPHRVDRMVLDSAVDPDHYGADGILPVTAAASEAGLHDWAAWTAGHDAAYHLGATREAVLAAVRGTIAAAARHPLKVGGYRVDDKVLPFVLMNGLDDDQDEANAALAADFHVLREAARGGSVRPTDDLRDTLDFVFTGADSPAGGSQVAVLCGDQAAARDPETYWRRVQSSRAAEPVMGPLLNDISPCAFWPTAPREAPTRIGNGVPALIVNSTGDTRTTYQSALSLHGKLTASRLLTLSGARIHAVYPRYGDTCVNTVVDDYFRTGVLPATDLTCVKTATDPAPAL